MVGPIWKSEQEIWHDVNDLTSQYVLYPGHMIAMTGSVFMTVAIAMERYVAVHYPLDYNQVSRIAGFA